MRGATTPDKEKKPAHFDSIIKRDGRVVRFNKSKITDAIFKAAIAVGGEDRLMAEELAWWDAGICVHLSISSVATTAIQAMGTPDQQRQYLSLFTNPDGERKIPTLGAFLQRCRLMC